MADEEQQTPNPSDQSAQPSSANQAAADADQEVQQGEDGQPDFCLPGTINYDDFMRQNEQQLAMNNVEQPALPEAVEQQQQTELQPSQIQAQPQMQMEQVTPMQDVQAQPPQQMFVPMQFQEPQLQHQQQPQQYQQQPVPEQPASEEQEEEHEEVNVCEGLLDNDAFHGMVPMVDLKGLLKANGDFLIRSDEANKTGRGIILSVLWQGMIKHLEIRSAPKMGASVDLVNYKPTILELLEHHRKKYVPVSAEGVLLYKPVLRQSWELRRDSITVMKKLGEGAFGEVFKGTLKIRTTGRVVDVAIKQPKVKNATTDVVGEAMKEARIQKDYIHPNVVRLFGVSAEILPFMIVLEFVGGGSLDLYMQRNKQALGPAQKAMICFDVSCGLSYLHAKDCIHRDIAARNCLVCNKYSIIKISDFGLSSVGSSQVMEKNKPAPIRWLAPDVFKTGRYVKPSDIWSLGVVYWEVFMSCAEMPYKNLTLAEVQNKLCNEQGFHLEMPPCTQPDVRALALKCWNPLPGSRPTAEQCTNALLGYAHKERYDRIPGMPKMKAGAKKLRKNINQRKAPSKSTPTSSNSRTSKSSMSSGSGTLRGKGNMKNLPARKPSMGMGASREGIKPKIMNNSGRKKVTRGPPPKKNSKKSLPKGRKK